MSAVPSHLSSSQLRFPIPRFFFFKEKHKTWILMGIYHHQFLKCIWNPSWCLWASRWHLGMQQIWGLGLIPWRRAHQPCTLAWRIPGTEKSGRLQSIGSQRVGHNESDLSLALDVTAFPFHSIWTPKLVIYWVGQKVHSGFSIRCYEKTWMNILANSTLFFLHNLIICQVLLI